MEGSVDHRRIVRTAPIINLVSFLLVVGAVWLYFLNQAHIEVPATERLSMFNIIMAVTFPPVGLLILRKHPTHNIGRIFLAIGLGQAINQFSLQYAFYAFEVNTAAPLGPVFYWLYSYVFFPCFLLLIVLLAIFPNGKLPSLRWIWLLVTLFGSFLLYTLYMVLEPLTDPKPARFIPPPENSFGFADLFFDLAFLLMFVSVGAALVALVVRLRRSKGMERQQLKWFVFSGVFVGLMFFIMAVPTAMGAVIPSLWDDSGFVNLMAVINLIQPLSVGLIPLSVGISILRHRLYGIDLIIRKTLIYSTLTVLFALIYGIAVILFQSFFFWLTNQDRSEISIILSTLIIAALFAPLRRRVQDIIDCRFYRSRYDAEHALAGFSAELRHEVDLQSIVAHTEKVIEETLQPMGLSLVLLPSKEERQQES